MREPVSRTDEKSVTRSVKMSMDTVRRVSNPMELTAKVFLGSRKARTTVIDARNAHVKAMIVNGRDSKNGKPAGWNFGL